MAQLASSSARHVEATPLVHSSAALPLTLDDRLETLASLFPSLDVDVLQSVLQSCDSLASAIRLVAGEDKFEKPRTRAPALPVTALKSAAPATTASAVRLVPEHERIAADGALTECVVVKVDVTLFTGIPPDTVALLAIEQCPKAPFLRQWLCDFAGRSFVIGC